MIFTAEQKPCTQLPYSEIGYSNAVDMFVAKWCISSK